MERFEDEYGEFEAIGKTWSHEPPAHRRLVERFELTTIRGAGVWLTNDAGEVLLVRNEGEDGWSDPGGKINPARRLRRPHGVSYTRETDVACRLTGGRELHVIRNRDAERNQPIIFEPIAIFDGEYADGEPRSREGEIAEVGWFRNPPETVRHEAVRTRPYPGAE